MLAVGRGLGTTTFLCCEGESSTRAQTKIQRHMVLRLASLPRPIRLTKSASQIQAHSAG